MEQTVILEWDSTFFGFKVASIPDPQGNWDLLQSCGDSCVGQGVVLAYCKSTHAVPEKWLSRFGGSLVDQPLVYGRNGEKTEDLPGGGGAARLRVYRPDEDAGLLVPMALQSGVFSRFKVDPRFPDRLFVKLFTNWIRKAVSRERAREVLVTEDGDGLTGFVTVEQWREGVSEIGLIAVCDRARGRGVGKSLVYGALRSGIRNGCFDHRVETQLANVPAQKLYEACGYQVLSRKYTYHFWFQGMDSHVKGTKAGDLS